MSRIRTTDEGADRLQATFKILGMLGFVMWVATATACETAMSRGGFAPLPAVELEQIAALRAIELFPLEAQSGVFERRTTERSDPREYEYELRPEGDEWVFEITDRHRVYLRRLEDGGIGLRRYEDLRQDIEIDADPAVLMLPGKLDGEVHEGTVELTIRGLLGRGTMRGQGHYRLRVAGTREVETHNGTRQAYIIEQQQQVRMPLARAEVQIETAYVEGLGRVMDRMVREHRVLGLFGGDAQETYQRVK